MKKCPFCAEEIQVEAIKCRYCGERLDVGARTISSVTEDFRQLPWLFVGAYAQYSGPGKAPYVGEVEAYAREEITAIDWDNNRYQAVAQGGVVKKVFGKSVKLGGESTISGWYPIGKPPDILPDKSIKIAEYDSVVHIDNLGVRDCIILEYAKETDTSLVFWDKKLRWALKYMVILRIEKKDYTSLSKEIGRAIQTLGMIGDSRAEINQKKLIWTIQDLKDELKKSKHPSLREIPIVLLLRETNIPGLEYL